jgi:putative mycofactocin binding protein MftB
VHFPSNGRRVRKGEAMKAARDSRYVLAPGTQVREEDFGLLFYTMRGPRLYFLSSGQMLDISFFQGELTLDQWIRLKKEETSVPEERIRGIRKSLDQLRDKGVIFDR